jgi:crotonobetainyl-CoA:carnitine CoA-transferase CaiB-like acyl-CoA transferase
MMSVEENSGPLRGLRVLDLSRILAGPTLSQNLGDLGADVLKIERPGAGDDTRKWGPPYLDNREGGQSGWSAYYLCANRNKRSVAVDISRPEGQRLIHALAQKADVLIENFKVGGLEKYGLDYDAISQSNRGLIYCSITGFGQTGPLRQKPGYDAMIQAMGGIMSITGPADGEPMKVGVGIADVMCGMYAGMAVLAALHHRERTGEGQYIDMSLFDSQVAWLINEGLNYLTSGEVPQRRGTAHPNIVPYQVFPTADGYFMLAVGNDGQFARFCALAGMEDAARDERFATNPARVKNREALVRLIRAQTLEQTTAFWIDELGKVNVPCGPINDIGQVLESKQAQLRGMRIRMEDSRAAGGGAELIGNPMKLSKTPVSYRRFPPRLGEHTRQVLANDLGLNDEQIQGLVENGIIAEAQ